MGFLIGYAVVGFVVLGAFIEVDEYNDSHVASMILAAIWPATLCVLFGMSLAKKAE